MKGVIRNVLINVDDICKEVPRVMGNNSVVQVRCTLTCKPLAFQFSLKPESPYKNKVNVPLQKTCSFRYQGIWIDKSANYHRNNSNNNFGELRSVQRPFVMLCAVW